MNDFECIFCGKKIDSDNEKVSSMLVTTNWDTENEQSQQFFCHFDCFKEKCQNKNAIYIDEEYHLTMEKPGNVPGSKAIYHKIINKDGKTIKVYKDTFDPKGNLVHRKDK